MAFVTPPRKLRLERGSWIVRSTGVLGIELLAGGERMEVQRHVAFDGQRRDLRLAHGRVEVETVIL